MTLREAKRVLRAMAGEDASFAPRLGEAAAVLLREIEQPTRLEWAMAQLLDRVLFLRGEESVVPEGMEKWDEERKRAIAAFDRKRKVAKRG